MTTKIDTRTLTERYYNADHISDREIIENVKFYDHLAHLATRAGKEFKILAHQTLKLYQGLEQYGVARKLKMEPNRHTYEMYDDIKNIKTLYQRYYDAEPIKDKEIIIGYHLFKEIGDMLAKTGPTYKHFFTEAVTLAHRLEELADARKLTLHSQEVQTETHPLGYII